MMTCHFSRIHYLAGFYVHGQGISHARGHAARARDGKRAPRAGWLTISFSTQCSATRQHYAQVGIDFQAHCRDTGLIMLARRHDNAKCCSQPARAADDEAARMQAAMKAGFRARIRDAEASARARDSRR